MSRSLAHLFVSFTFLSAALLLASCQREPPGVSRALVDAIDKGTADARKARVSNVEYDAFVDIASSDENLIGELEIRFDLSDSRSDLTVDFTGGTLDSIEINGRTTSAEYNSFYITLATEDLQEGTNTVKLTYSHPYGSDGTGLHRFIDPEDGLTYMHSYLWPYYANRLLPSFDQPNIKANFSLRVLAPESWNVFSMSPGMAEPGAEGNQLWSFARTPKISTYMFSLHAGPYAIWTDDSGEVPLRLMARQSLAEFVEVEEWFEITQNGMTFFGEYFDIPYPFEKYDQLIVPEFTIGGMENAAAVSFTEFLVQRQASDRAQRQSRAGTILHELAHMWFGDLVTHDWWNGMWLNESFATQLATIALAETTEFADQWHAYFVFDKQAAYYEDSRVTTHPIEMPVASTDQFTILFDAITYEKGGSVLKQLQHRVGTENYRLGVSAYLKENAFGLSTLADFIDHQSRSAGINLGEWSEEWLMQTGFNTLSAETVCQEDELQSLTILQHAQGSNPQLRTHEVELATYGFNDGQLVVSNVIPMTVSGERASAPIQPGQPCPVLVNPNYNDWTYAKIAITDADEAVLSEHLGVIEDPLSKSMFLMALYDRAIAGETSLASYANHALRLAESEQNPVTLEQITNSLSRTVGMMQRLRPEVGSALPDLVARVEQFALHQVSISEDSDVKQLWLNTFLNVASSEEGLRTVRVLLNDEVTFAGVDISPEIRWRLLTILSRHDADGIEDLLAAEIEQDGSDFAQRRLLSARAAAPTLANKKHWVSELQNPRELTSLAKQRAVMAALFPGTQTDLQLKVLEQIASSLPQMSREADAYFLTSYTRSLFRPMCLPQSNAIMLATLDEVGPQLNPTALRFLREAHQLDVECMALRSVQ